MQNQLTVFLDRCLSTLPLPFHGSKCQGRQRAFVSHSLLFQHFCMHKLPSGNCVSDLPFKVREEFVSLMSSASNSFCFFAPVFEKIKFRVSRKNRVGWEIGNQFFLILA